MKSTKILLALVIFTFSFHSAVSSGLNSVFSYDGNAVWAVGANGYVIYSPNGGNTWSDVSIGTETYNSVFSVGPYIWIAGNNGMLQMTSDNGYNWTQLTLAGGANLKSVFFINASTGWIVGDNGTILKSTNSGFNWTAQTSNTTNNLNCITFTDNLNGVSSGANGTVVITTTGGTDWTALTTPTTKELLSIDMKSGTIIATGVDAITIKSTNNGTTWSIIDYKIITKSGVNSVFMFDPNTYYSCGGGGFIRKSTDGGLTFTFQINPMLAELYKIYFYDINHGWAVGRDNNVVIRTTDGGNTWQMPAGTTQSFSWLSRLNTGTTSGSIFSLSAQNPNEMFVCANHRIYRSLDYGINWQQISTQIPFGDTQHALIVSSRDSNKMLVAFDSIFNNPPHSLDKIFRTTDYGNTWNVTFSQAINPDGNPLAYDPDHPDTVYLGLTDSLVYRSTDFGLNWLPAGPAHLGKICVMKVLYGHSNILLCGAISNVNTANLYRSTDFGFSWAVVNSNTGYNSEIPGIAASVFIENKIFQTAYFGGSGGVHVSTDQGLTWVTNYPDSSSWGIDIARDDPNVIISGNGSLYGAFLTVNGGTNWFTLPNMPTNANQSFMCFNRKLIFSQQTSAIYQLVPSYNYPIGILSISTEIPKQFSLEQNYPNPFNPETKILFSVPENVKRQTSKVKLIIFDVLGREVTKLVNEQLKPGTYEVNWDASNYPSGAYFYRLQTEFFTESKKMVLIK